MLYDDLFGLIEDGRPRRKPRGNERSKARRVEDYLYEELEDYRPRKHKNRYEDGDDIIEHNRRDRQRDPYWKRRRQEVDEQ